MDRNETLAEEKVCLAAEKDALAGRNETQAAHIRRLEHLSLELIRLLYGKRSERLTADERQLAFEDLEGAAAEAEAETAASDPSPPRSPKRPRAERNIGHLPEHLERIEQAVEPESTLCPRGCRQMMKIGENRAERLDIVPAQLRVIVNDCMRSGQSLELLSTPSCECFRPIDMPRARSCVLPLRVPQFPSPRLAARPPRCVALRDSGLAPGAGFPWPPREA